MNTSTRNSLIYTEAIDIQNKSIRIYKWLYICSSIHILFLNIFHYTTHAVSMKKNINMTRYYGRLTHYTYEIIDINFMMRGTSSRKFRSTVNQICYSTFSTQRKNWSERDLVLKYF